MADTLAAIDIGTNSVHMVVARVNDHGFEVVAKEKEQVRLGSDSTQGGGDMKHLAPASMDRAVDALVRFRQVADISDAEIRAVATSAVREAENRDRFIDRVRREAGIDIDVISGFEEARLIHLGVRQAVPVGDRKMLLIDIGGGSTELLIGQGDQTLAVRSLKVGAVRLTERFFAASRLDPDAVAACRNYVRGFLSPFVREARRVGFDVAVGCSGTIEALARVIEVERGTPPVQTLNNFRFSARELRDATGRLAGAPTVAARRKIPGVEARRADIILAGALIADEATRQLGVDHLVVADAALREGVLLDTLQRRTGSARHHLHDLRARSVEHLMALTDEDRDHSRRVAGLALELFDQTQPVHRLGDGARELLHAGALLANVGLFVSHAGHHKHSYYVIRNSEHLTGFTDREIELIAQIARYHRKSAPKPKHREFSRLPKADQRLVRVLAGLLRVAIGLDRTHQGLVRSVRCHLGEDEIVIEPLVDPAQESEADISLEVYTAGQRSLLLAEALQRRVTVGAAAGEPQEHLRAES